MTTTIELIKELMQAHNGHADEGVSTFSESAQRLRELDRPDCVWIKDANDYFNTQCGGYFDLDKRNFCPNCGGQVKEST